MPSPLAAIRKAASPAIFAQGAKLAREEGGVRVERASDDEVVLRVYPPGWAVPPTVVLYLETVEWACDCGGSADPCPHVVAAALALDQANQRGAALPSARGAAGGKLSYRLATRDGAMLALERYVVQPDGAEHRLAPGGSVTSSPVPIAEISASDLALDRLLEALRGPSDSLPAERAAEVLGALAGCSEVLLDGRPVRASSEPVAPRVVVEDHPRGGFALRLERDPRVTGVAGRAVVLCGDTLHPVAHADLAGERLERLPATRVFALAQAVELVAEALPELAERRGLAVEVRSNRLPARGRPGATAPRVEMDIALRGHTLAVVPTVVYGDPPQARVEGGRLVYVAGPVVPARDEAAEQRLAEQLRDELNLAVGRRAEFEGRDAVRFASRLRELGGADAARDVLGAGRRALVPRLEMGGDGASFEMYFETPDSESEGPAGPARRADAETVLRAWQEGLGLVPLEGGGWAELPADWLALHGHRVADLLAARGGDGRVPVVAMPALARLCDALEQPRPPGFERLAPLLLDFDAIPPAELPADVTADLRAYQRHGVDWLSFLRDAGLGAVLADDMGLGKTLQTLCAVRGRTLVVCPRSVVHNWADEIRRFRPGLRAQVFHGPRRQLDPEADVTLTTYAVLRLDAALLAGVAWDAVVLDEAQAIKNPDSQAARAAYDLPAGFRVALSGTPVENRLEELWSLLHFADRGLLGGRGDFNERYAAPIAAGDATAAARLRERIRPFVLRRMKREVATELPPRADAVLYCELDEREREIYDAVRLAARRDVVARLASPAGDAAEGGGRRGGGNNALAALEALLRLRQAACHPALVPGQTSASSSKVARLLAALEQAAADGHRALVFSQWTALLDLVEPHLRAAGIAFTRLDGATRDRAAVVAEFQSDGGPPVMLVSLKAGGTGLNLTAADHVFLLDPWWNPAVEDQAADRAHRIGQDRPVMVYRMVAKDTVEEKILALQARKRGLAEVAVGGADQAQGITRDELLALLE